MSQETVFVNSFTKGILGPDIPMLGPVKDGGYIVANTAPGCWGPMLTPEIRGGHEVTTPVLVEGAEPGDTVAIRIISVDVSSEGTASGNDSVFGDRCLGDPFVAGRCPKCGTLYPPTHLEGIGPESVRCNKCGAPAAPFSFTSGYTIAFDDERNLGITLNKEAAESAAMRCNDFMRKPDNSIQNPVVALAPHDLPGMVSRMKPFLGQLGTTPIRNTPDSHNAGDFACFLVDAPHEYAIKKEQLRDVTDGHLDINRVRAGAVLFCPVRIPGAGVYLGDMHAMQGDGEIAGHTCDVAGVAVLQVSLIKGLSIEGPILLPLEEDLPYLAKPLSEEEERIAKREADKWGVELEESVPISFVGSGENLNAAIDNAMERASKLLGETVPQIMNRLTITGGLEIGRAPGTVSATFKAPAQKLRELGLYSYIQKQYNLK